MATPIRYKRRRKEERPSWRSVNKLCKQIGRSLALLSTLLSTAGAWAGSSFDSTTPPCEVPIFHWTGVPVTTAKASAYLAKKVAGTTEANQTMWAPFGGQSDGADLAGKGIYFEADPFSSHSYGNYLVIAFLKPQQPAKDVRSLGLLDDPEKDAEAAPAIRSDNHLLIHQWISAGGGSDAVVLRARKTDKAEDLPLILARTEAVDASGEQELKPWSNHAVVAPGESLGSALQKYMDRFLDLSDIWASQAASPTDDLIWSAIRIDLSSATGDSIGELSIERTHVGWEPFDSCDEMSAHDLNVAIKKFRKAGALGATTNASSACDLKSKLVAEFKESKGYSRYLSIFNHLQNLKHQLGIDAQPSESEVLVSTLNATCR